MGMAKWYVAGLVVFFAYYLSYVGTYLAVVELKVLADASVTNISNGTVRTLSEQTSAFTWYFFELGPYLGALFGAMTVVLGALVEQWQVLRI
jgi:hypothetical protein